jgi:N-methylhydantoinase B/oxoprolinase/acetone carboxylase alpha subunit
MEIETGSSAQTDKIYPYMGMFGGYPGHHGYMRLLLDTNVKQLIQEKKPLVHGNDRPGYCELEHNLQGKSVLEVGAGYFVKDPIKDGDILQGFYGAIPSGFGDPLKRDLKLVKKDLDSGYLTIESCRRIYGVEAACNPQTGEWTVDEKATNSLRTQKKQQRISQGVSTAEWWRERRRELLENRPPAMVRRMYNDSLSKGKRWSKEYRDFWNLSADFVYKEN